MLGADEEFDTKVAVALNGKGFFRLLQAKQALAGGGDPSQFLLAAMSDLDAAEPKASQRNLPVVLGNKAYVLYLSDREGEAERVLRKALELGGDKLREAELADTDLYPSRQDSFRALVQRLSGAHDLVTRFDQAYRDGGMEGLWEDLQSCYADAVAHEQKRDEIGRCLLLDQLAKSLDDAYVKRMSELGADAPNTEWYEDSVFAARLMEYSDIAFGDTDAYRHYIDMNIGPVSLALQQIMVERR